MPELKVKGLAYVRAIEACPVIADGSGSVVTARFATRSVDMIASVEIMGADGAIEVIEGTPNHPFWSLDRNDWVPLGELEEGEHLQGEAGVAFVLTHVIVNRSVPVYNIEVHGEHVYQVGELGFLVHNACPAPIGGVLNVGKSTAKVAIENGVLKVSDIYVQGGDDMLRMFDQIRKMGAANGTKSFEATAEFLNFPLRDRLMKMGFQFEKIGEGPFGDIWKITGGL